MVQRKCTVLSYGCELWMTTTNSGVEISLLTEIKRLSKLDYLEDKDIEEE